ncbi:MAG: hypothetical protein CVT92_06800 [Bacteroidetes bacterium HGW-Bacteroidetes-1]|jgi:hypothetical protein|nr:MAG: hypothetical protein CVT92_06800 [Bacteroidetes bacterium HGW-Bacteroidetes-1]
MKGRNKYILIIFFVSFLTGVSVRSQTVEAIGLLSDDSISIGQQIGFELNLKIPEGFHVQWPQWSDTLASNLEILHKGNPETLPADKDGNVWMKQQMVLTTFDTGWIYIPGIDIQFAPAGDTIFYTAQSNPLMLRVETVAIDTTGTFKPIKDPLAEPITFAEILPWIIGILGLATLLFIIVWLYMRRRNKVKPLDPLVKPGIPPHIHALNQLEELRLKKLWQNGKVKDYYTQLSDIIRAYIEAQFPVNAIEMTTYEILAGLQPMNINSDAISKLANAFELADLVKFAKAQPSSMENDISLNHMIDFVNESHFVVQPTINVENGKEESL